MLNENIPSQCIIVSEHEKELEAHQTAAPGKASENTSKHVSFYWHTYHHLKDTDNRLISEGDTDLTNGLGSSKL